MKIILGLAVLTLHTRGYPADQLHMRISPRTALFKPFIYYIQQKDLKRVKHYAESSLFSEFLNWRDDKGCTPLWHAVNERHVSIVSFLLESKADPGIPDNKKVYPLKLAQDKNLEKIMALLLK